MKYKQILDTNMVPEWRNQYLDYDSLDAALNKAIESKNIKCRQKGVDSYFELIKFNQKFGNFFSRECLAQLDKINSFHKEKLTEMKGKFNNLQDQLDQILSSAVYREIQPHISDHNHRELSYQKHTQHGTHTDPASYNTVSSVSDLFNNLKQSLGMRRDSPDSVDSANGRQPIEHGASFLPRMKQRLSLVPVLTGEGARRCSHASRRGKEKIHIFARKLSESLTSSANKISTNVGHLAVMGAQRAASNENRSDSNHTYQQRLNRSKMKIRKQMMGEDLSDSAQVSVRAIHRLAASSGGDAEEFSQQSFQTLAGVSAPSRSKIIASYKKKLSNLKFAFRELYFNLVVFEQYTQLNHTGFQQILRKHDRMFASTLGRKFYEEHVQTADFYNNLQVIDRLIENLEHIYTLHFEKGNRRKAIEKLSVPANIYKPASPKLDFRVGYELGLFSVLFILVILTGLIVDTGYEWRTVFRLYRSPLILIVFLFQTGISIVIWKHYKINHVLIFELNPRNNLSFQHFFEFGSFLGITWSISVLLFLFSNRFDLRPSICPLVVLIIIFVYLVNPTQTGHYQARFWFLRILGRIVMAPFTKGTVRFADFWIADQLVSIVPLFLDLEFMFCFYTTGDVLSVSHLSPDYASRCVTRNPMDLIVRTIVAALPAWFRCAQCLKRWHDENWLRMHLANAAKYWCMVMVVVLSSISQYNKHSFELDTMRIIWMVAAIFTSSLTAYWDIIYDFGLFNKYDTNDQSDEESRIKRSASNNSSSGCSLTAESFYCKSKERQNKRYPFLRKELVYPVWVYYFAIVENIILRFGWIITISLTEFSGIEAGLVVSLLAPMEMFRRFVWNCIRLENEQLNNCGLFRAVRDIPIEVVAPIDESHLDKVIMMMDSKDGPSMRNRLMKRRTLRPDRASFMILQNSPLSKRCDQII